MSELTPASIKKLKVAELRSELTNLGLDTKGNKPVLVQRLLDAISEVKDATIPNEENNVENYTQSTEEQSREENAQDVEPMEAAESENQVEETAPESSSSSQETVEEKVEEPKSVVAEQSVPEIKDDEQPPQEEASTVTEAETEVVSEKPVSEQSEEKVQKETETNNSETTPEPMDQTPAVVQTQTPAKEPEKPKEVVDHDTSVDFSKVEEEPEIEIDKSLVVLDKYSSDLFIKINSEALSCGTLKEECFMYLAGGAKATWGVKGGKVCFEVKITELHEVQLPETEDPKHTVRIGWSCDGSNLQLGENSLSYGYDSSGKKCTNSEFTEFGQTLDKDDVVTCYLDLESEVKKISFSKNGEDLGDAFELSEDVQDKVLFPHVYLKNADCSFNFGSQEEAWFAQKEGFSFIQNASDEVKAQSVQGPANKSDCEVLMMVGLPASGKTTWVKNYVAEHSDKNYNVLGTSEVLEKMKLLGVARKQETAGVNKHMDKAAKCLHRLFEIAPSKKRNFILDQTNVYLSAQSKKMRAFEGYKRKAIVCIPEQNTLKERMEERKNAGIELPYNTICDMKRNFILPKVGDHFDEVSYVDQNEEQSQVIVLEYSKEVGPPRSRFSSGGYEPDRKRPRQDDRPRYRNYGDNSGWSGHSPRDNRRYDNRRGGYQNPQYNRRGGGQYGGYGGNRGGYRDHNRGNRGGYHRGGYHDRNRSGGNNRNYGGNKNYGGNNSYGSSNYSNSNYGSGSQSRPQYSSNSYNSQQSSNYSNQQQSYSNYQQYYQQQQQQGYQQYSQQQQQPQAQQAQTTQGYQYPYYQQQGTYQQGGYSYGY